MKPKEVKKQLSDIIKSMSDNPADFVRNVDVDFTRNRELSFETVAKMLIGMGGKSLCKELVEWFDYSEYTANLFRSLIGVRESSDSTTNISFISG